MYHCRERERKEGKGEREEGKERKERGRGSD